MSPLPRPSGHHSSSTSELTAVEHGVSGWTAGRAYSAVPGFGSKLEEETKEDLEIVISLDEVVKAIENLNPGKSMVPDG